MYIRVEVMRLCCLGVDLLSGKVDTTHRKYELPNHCQI